MILAYLRGPTGDQCEEIQARDKANYGVITKTLIDRFSPADMRRSTYGNVAARNQSKLESVNEFASTIQCLVFRSFSNDVRNEEIEMSAREHFILGLKSELMRGVTVPLTQGIRTRETRIC